MPAIFGFVFSARRARRMLASAREGAVSVAAGTHDPTTPEGLHRRPFRRPWLHEEHLQSQGQEGGRGKEEEKEEEEQVIMTKMVEEEKRERSRLQRLRKQRRERVRKAEDTGDNG